jgi:Cof subfamily protein (haloacid dehalogenase superfamily)
VNAPQATPPSLFRPDLVASDLDGTLLPSTLEFSAATVAGVAAMRAAGVAFVISTGRMFKSARRMAAKLGLADGPIICYQGALVADLGTGEWLRHLPMDPAPAADVVRHMRKLGRHVNVYVGDELYVEDVDTWARRYAEYAEVGINRVDDLLTVVAEHPTKIVVATDPDEVTALLPGLQERWRDVLYVTRSLPHYIEINAPAATKSAALEWLGERLGTRRARTVACGDGLNDLDMLRWAGLGVAMAEGGEAVCREGDLVVPRDELGDLFARLAAEPPDAPASEAKAKAAPGG